MTEDKQAITERALELRRTLLPMKRALIDVDHYIEREMLNVIPSSLKSILGVIHPNMEEKTSKRRYEPMTDEQWLRDMTSSLLSLDDVSEVESKLRNRVDRYRAKVQAILALDLSEHPAIADILGPVKDL